MEETKSESKKKEKKIMLSYKKKRKKMSFSHTDTNTSTSSHREEGNTTVTLNDAFEHTEGNGRSKHLFALFFGIGYGVNGMITYSIPFMTKYPAFQCQDAEGLGYYPCDRDLVCDNATNSDGFSYFYDWSSGETISNWITSMGIECDDPSRLGMIGSMFFLGFWLGAATLLRFADIIGRRKMLIFSLAINIAITWGFLFVNSLFLIYVLTFLAGVVLSVRVSTCYMYEMEFVPVKYKKTANLVGAAADSAVVVFIAIFYYFFKYGWAMYYIYLTQSVFMLVWMFKIPETPSFLYSKKKWEELHECFDFIAKVNHSPPLKLKFDQEDHEESEHAPVDGSLRALMWDDKKRLVNLLIMVLNWSVCSFWFYVIGFFIKYFPGSVYTNGAMMGTADLIAALTVRVAQNYFSTKKGFLVSYTWVFCFTVLYLFCQNMVEYVPLLILCMRLGVTFAFGLVYFGNQEYFPPIFLSTVFGICNIFARTSTILSPMVAEVIPEPVITITVTAATAAICSAFLFPPEKEGDFSSFGKKGKIAFVEDNIPGRYNEFQPELEQKEADEIYQIEAHDELKGNH